MIESPKFLKSGYFDQEQSIRMAQLNRKTLFIRFYCWFSKDQIKMSLLLIVQERQMNSIFLRPVLILKQMIKASFIFLSQLLSISLNLKSPKCKKNRFFFILACFESKFFEMTLTDKMGLRRKFFDVYMTSRTCALLLMQIYGCYKNIFIILINIISLNRLNLITANTVTNQYGNLMKIITSSDLVLTTLQFQTETCFKNILIIKKQLVTQAKFIGKINRGRDNMQASQNCWKDLQETYGFQLIVYSLSWISALKVWSNICYFIQYNMSHSKLEFQGPNLQPQIISYAVRSQIIDKFLSIKQKSSVLNRETIYTALAIYEKYALKRLLKKGQNQEILIKRDITIAVCLWISVKVQCNEKSILIKILQLYEIPFTKQQMIQTEAEILQAIDYQLPLYNTYTSMILQFNKRFFSTIKDHAELVAQCLAFYGQAIKLSNDFVLEEELGIYIVGCLADRCINDARIRLACRSIRRNRSRRNQAQDMQIKANIAIKVCE